jgi:hypothetical protein
MSTDLLDDVVPALTQADFDRAYQLDAGIKKLAKELEDLKSRIKAEAKLGTKVHGNVIVKVSERRDKDIEAMTAAFPFEGYAYLYKIVLDGAKVPKEDLILKDPIKVVSITFADGS